MVILNFFNCDGCWSIFYILSSIGSKKQIELINNQTNAINEQIKAANEQARNDHERSRRTTAIEMLKFFDSRISRNASICRKIADKLSFEQAKSIFDQKEFYLNKDVEEDFKVAFPEANIHDKNEKEFIVKKEYSSHLRWELISYLNLLETVLAAWYHNIADQDIIEEQFRYLISHENN